jgi:RNA polymerase sigma-70 factor (ECF subfamily)
METPLRQVAQDGLHKDLQTRVGVSDLVQDTFMLAHRSAREFRGSSWGEMTAWLKRILENQIAKTLRDQKWSQKRSLKREVRLQEMKHQDLPVLDAVTPSQVLVAEEERELLDRALIQLPMAVLRRQTNAKFNRKYNATDCHMILAQDRKTPKTHPSLLT